MQKTIKPIYKGQVVEINLTEYGYDGYFAEALYYCDDATTKSLITMFIIQKDADGMPTTIIPVQKPQYITADRSDVRLKISGIVEVMHIKHYIEKYISDFTGEPFVLADTGDDIEVAS